MQAGSALPQRYTERLMGIFSEQPDRRKTLKEILNEITEKTLLCGDVTAQQPTSFSSQGIADKASAASSFRRAGFLAEIGWKRYHSGKYERPGSG